VRPDRNRAWFRRAIVAAALLVGCALLLFATFEGELPSPACPPGVGHGIWDPSLLSEAGQGSGEARELLEEPGFGASPEAAGDLRAGIVDERLVAALHTIAGEHRICVVAFREGHYFLPGVPDGPRIPEGYGRAGGLPNTHYYGRAADIWWVDGEPVEGNGADPAVVDVGRVLVRIPPQRRPDQIIGPRAWTEELGYGREEGWILAPDQLALHKDHIHLGYMEGEGTRNVR
jgi:hypothetical protein